eukprot:420694_1
MSEDLNNVECGLIVGSNSIGCIVSLTFVCLFVYKQWYIENDMEKITMFMQKYIVYLSYLFFLFSASTFTLNLVYIGINCYDMESQDSIKYDIVVILFILSLSTFKSIFNLLMVFQLYYGYKSV